MTALSVNSLLLRVEDVSEQLGLACHVWKWRNSQLRRCLLLGRFGGEHQTSSAPADCPRDPIYEYTP